VRLHTTAGNHLHREPLSSLVPRLDPGRFVRIHRTAVVNLDHIRHLEREPRGRYAVVLRDGTRLIMTAPYRENFERLVGDF
jgi:two-component system LytT family response regulator